MMITREEMKEIVHEVFDAKWAKEMDVHEDHHRFIDTMIKKEERAQQRWETIKTQVLGWGVIALIGSVGTAVYHWFFTGGK